MEERRQILSAPKRINFRPAPTLNLSQQKQATPKKQELHYEKQNIFFNDQISIAQLQHLGNIHSIQEDENEQNINQQFFAQWISKSCTTVRQPAEEFHQSLISRPSIPIDEPLPLEKTPPPPGFIQQPRKLWADISSDSDFTPLTGKTPKLFQKEEVKQEKPKIEVKANLVTLSQPPSKKKSIIKREKRGKFDAEMVDTQFHTGFLKFYQLKKRFGFITLEEDNSDVFLCEDDLILSNINHKKFKDDVINRVLIRFKFRIKCYQEKGREKRKAIDIELI